jgi:hypothetical protein
MKRIFTILAVLLLAAGVFLPKQADAQAPEKMNYQAVIRDESNNLVISQSVRMQVSILQGSASGMAVYVETQNPTTNANGLVSIEIGDGIVQSGNFPTIDWANGPYFIKTETDPTGGMNYTITGTVQLLSVPYALYAKTAGSTSETSGHYVGELYGGGVVFWVDDTGQHGLIVSMVDLSTFQAWSNITDILIGTTNDWDGANNTIAIIGQAGHTSSAAKLCDDYTNANYGTGTYSDWYLPSIAELNHVWNNFYEVQKSLTNDGNAATTPLVKTSYWTSSEYDVNIAWYFTFYYGNTNYYLKSTIFYVRAVRAF